MAHLESRNHISPDSNTPITLRPLFHPRITAHSPPEPIREKIAPTHDRAFFADPEKKSLFSVAKRVDLTESIGTVLEDVQISQLSPQQLDELAALVTERGVVRVFEHFGVLDRHPTQKLSVLQFVNIHGSCEDHREILNGDFHADTSFEINPPSYSLLQMEEHPEVSQYGLYDALSGAYKKFVDGLHAVHTSHDTILDLWGVGPSRPPIDTHHPAVQTHPVTGLKALNVTPGFVTGFAELKKVESDKILDFLAYHIHAADDQSVAMWNDRCTLHRVIPGTYEGQRRGIRTTVFGEKPYHDPTSESRK
ncbi:TauD/TfdA dioxygenase family protein [Aspergillus undulatus]|uniref:TauD/TfdA dioxygenase family protein n=1 Tax=Aspergillus undulatus TaxID=1810928 RepID=UPI003CCE4155